MVTVLPPKITYFPNFITEDEEKDLLDVIYNVKENKWTQLAHRRLQNWGGLPHPKGMLKEPIPVWLQSYFDRITELGAFGEVKPNHCLVNEYKPGQGIMPHEDGSLFYPTVATITIGSHGVLDFYKHREMLVDDDTKIKNEDSMVKRISLDARYIGSVLLEKRSLVLVQEDLYKRYLHGIKEVTHDMLTPNFANINQTESSIGEVLARNTRVSLTIRHVPKTIEQRKLTAIFGKQRK